jgi:hypothetical protein
MSEVVSNGPNYTESSGETSVLFERKKVTLSGYKLAELPEDIRSLCKQIGTAGLVQLQTLVPQLEEAMATYVQAGIEPSIEGVIVTSLDASGNFNYDRGETIADFRKVARLPLLISGKNIDPAIKVAMLDCIEQLLALIQGKPQEKKPCGAPEDELTMTRSGGKVTCEFAITAQGPVSVQLTLPGFQYSPTESAPIPKDPKIKSLVDAWCEQLGQEIRLTISSTVRKV